MSSATYWYSDCLEHNVREVSFIVVLDGANSDGGGFVGQIPNLTIFIRYEIHLSHIYLISSQTIPYH